LSNNKQSHQGHCFTAEYSGLSRTLLNQVRLESFVNPSERIDVKALWDTGASMSVIRPEIAMQLNLLSVSMVSISTPTTANQASNVYLVNLYLPNRVVVPNVHVAEGIPSGCDMLIGMDIIGLGDFAVSNYTRKTIFSFRMPSMAQIDFVKHSYLLPIKNSDTIGRNDPCPCGNGKKYKQCCGK
jgi:predicted aspartyl protease